LKYFYLILSLCLCVSVVSPTYAAPIDRQVAEFASDEGTALYIVGGVLLPLIQDGKAGKKDSLQAADALVSTVILNETIRFFVTERRPDGSSYDSFPSGHTAAAYSIATVQAELLPEQSTYWYLGAAAIGWSRVRLNRHHTHDVLAGAALGHLTAK
jgi:membrane-associated phospholipid phosphatase